VYEVTSHGDLVWQYGGASGAAEDVPGPDQLDDPVAAQLVSGQGATVGYVLICDAAPTTSSRSRAATTRRGAERRIHEPQHRLAVRHARDIGRGVDELRAPRSAFESNGDVVICDAAADRVIAVRHSDYDAGKANDGYTQGSIDWHYGTPTRPTLALFRTTSSRTPATPGPAAAVTRGSPTRATIA